MVMCSPHSTHLEFIFSQEELWEEIHSSLLDSWFQLKKHFSWNERMANVNIVIILMNMTQLTLELDFMCPIAFFEAGFSWCQPIWHILFSQAGELFWNLAGLPNGAPSSQGPAQQRGWVTLHASQRVHPGAALQLCWQHRNFPSTKNPLWYLISRWGLPLISGEQAGRKHSMSKCWPKRRNTFSKCCYHRTMKTLFCQQPG